MPSAEWSLISEALELLLSKGYDGACESKPDLQPLLEALCEELRAGLTTQPRPFVPQYSRYMTLDVGMIESRAGDIVEARRRAKTGEPVERAGKGN